MKNRILKYFVLLQIILVLTGCNNFNTTDEKQQNENYATLKVGLSEYSEKNRNAGYSGTMSPYDLDEYTIIKIELWQDSEKIGEWVSDEDEEEYALYLMQNDFIIISPGYYSFTLKLYDYNNNLAASPTIQKRVVHGENYLIFKTKPIETEGNAKVTVEWQYFEKFSYIKAGLYEADNVNEEITGYSEILVPQIDEEEEIAYVVYEKTGLPFGQYALRFDFYSTESTGEKLVNTLIDIIYIEGNRLTEAWHFIEEGMANSIYKVNLDLNFTPGANEGWKDGYVPLAERSMYTELALPGSNHLNRNNYIFLGWYTDKECTVPLKSLPEFDGQDLIPLYYAKDVTAYAKWVPNYLGMTLDFHHSAIPKGKLSVTFDALTREQVDAELENATVKRTYVYEADDDEVEIASYTWYVDDILKGSSETFVVDPATLSGGYHTISVLAQAFNSSVYYSASSTIHVQKEDWQLIEVKNNGSFYTSEFSDNLRAYKYKIPEDQKLELLAYDSFVSTEQSVIEDTIDEIYNYVLGTGSNKESIFEADYSKTKYNKYLLLSGQEELGFACLAFSKKPFFIDTENNYLYFLDTNLSQKQLQSLFLKDYPNGLVNPYSVVLKFSDGKTFKFSTFDLRYNG